MTRFVWLMAVIGLAAPVAAAEGALNAIEGFACAPIEGSEGRAAEQAWTLARREALTNAGSFIEAERLVQDFTLERDAALNISAGTLHQVRQLDQYEEDGALCVRLAAKYDPDEIARAVADYRAEKAAYVRKAARRDALRSGMDAERCRREVEFANILRDAMADKDMVAVRDGLIERAQLEALAQSSATLAAALDLPAASAGRTDRYLKRLKARAGGYVRTGIVDERLVEEADRTLLQVETLSLVCLPKTPALLPMPVFVEAFEAGGAADPGELKRRLASALDADDRIALALVPDEAEIRVRARLEQVERSRYTVGPNASAPLPPGDYWKIAIALSLEGEDALTGQRIAHAVASESSLPVGRDPDAGIARLLRRQVDRLAAETADKLAGATAAAGPGAGADGQARSDKGPRW